MTGWRAGRRFSSVSLNWMLPNMITLAGLVSGLTGLRFAMEGSWAAAVAMVALAAVFDALDGRMARLLKSTSAFGAALDSLSDAVVFGIVPALLLYLWALAGHGNIAWVTTLFFAVCVVLRLARFDSELPDQPDYTKAFFVGIPAPATALLVMVPVAAHQLYGADWLRDARLVSAVLVLAGIGAVSVLPTYNGKSLKLPVGAVIPVLAMLGFLGAAAVNNPWVVYLLAALAYLASFPFSVLSFRRRARLAKKQAADKVIEKAVREEV
jgi:CDP-diacylglycerol--serine O-phosphatidyltransferase